MSRRAALVAAFPFLWGAITAGYAGLVVYRYAALGRPPGLTTLAAVAAVTSVWFEFAAIIRHDALWRVGSAVALLVTIAANTIVAVNVVNAGRALPIPRLCFTFLFVLVFIQRLIHLPAYR